MEKEGGECDRGRAKIARETMGNGWQEGKRMERCDRRKESARKREEQEESHRLRPRQRERKHPHCVPFSPASVGMC